MLKTEIHNIVYPGVPSKTDEERLNCKNLRIMRAAIRENYLPIRHSKSKIRTGLLCLFFMLSFSSIKFFPGMLVVQDVFTGLVLLFLVLIYPHLLLTKKIRIGWLEFYSLLILIVAPNVSAYMAYIEFGQPYWYGLLAQRKLILIGSSLMFIYLHKRLVFSLEDVERALLWLAWFSLIASTLANLLLDASQLGNQAGFSSAGMDGEGAKLILETAFIIYGFFYYAFTSFGLNGGEKHHVYFSLLFLAYLVFVAGGRSALVAAIASYLFFLFKWKNPDATIVSSVKIAALLIVLAIFFYVFPSDSLKNLETKFEDAIQVVLSGQEGNDVSANVRILEMYLAAPYIDKNWLLGSGAISNQWEGGFSELIGYFHPSDIGLYGVVFQYGLLGLLFFSAQLYFILKYSRQLSVNSGQYRKLTNAMKGFLLYFVLNSIATGRYVFLVEQSIFCISILYCATQVVKQRFVLRSKL